jgi:hypothetical protein
MSKHTGRHPGQGAYVDGGAAEDVQHHRMQDHALGGGSGDGVSVATRATGSGTDIRPDPGIELPDTIGDLPETAPRRTRRRLLAITGALVALAAVAVALVLFVPRPADVPSAPVDAPARWDGDWKNLIVEGDARGADGKGKDTLVESDAPAYSGDWKDLLVE